MENFKNRRDALLEIATIENKTDLLQFMGRMVTTMDCRDWDGKRLLTKSDCEAIAHELQQQWGHFNL